MTLRVVGAGLPRTGTGSLKEALSQLLGGRCYHMNVIPGHPFDLGDGWRRALAHETVDWDQLLAGFVASADWPASLFWRELSEAYPDALVLLSMREDAETWWHSADETILPYARMAMSPDWKEGRGLVDILEYFAGTQQWDNPALMMDLYKRHNDEVRATIPAERLLEWRAQDGWEPICRALDLPIPNQPFPWNNSRSTWK